MADTRLVGIEIPLTPEQARLIRQVTDEDMTSLVFAVNTSDESVISEFLEGQEPLKQEGVSQCAFVLYETTADLVERIEQQPILKEDIEQRITARRFGPSASFQELRSGLAGKGFSPSFQGILAAAAAW